MIGSYISKYNPWLATIKWYTNWWNKWTFPYLASRLSTLTSSHSGQTLNIFLLQRVQFIFKMCNNEIFWDNHVGCKYGDLSFIVLRVCKYLVLKFEIEKYWITLWKEKNHTLEWIFNEQIFLFAVWYLICFFMFILLLARISFLFIYLWYMNAKWHSFWLKKRMTSSHFTNIISIIKSNIGNVRLIVAQYDHMRLHYLLKKIGRF